MTRLHKPHPPWFAAEGAAEILFGIGLLIGLAILAAVVCLAVNAIGSAVWG